MTDEERQKLCEDLREYHMADCQKAADEIERLVKENVRLVAENSQLKTELDDS